MTTEDSMYEQWLYLACDDCQISYNGDCEKHPLEFARHTPAPMGDPQRPVKTLPDFLYIAPSIQKPGRLGVFTSVVLPSRIAFGPYEGVRIYDTARTSSYTWELPGDRTPLLARDRSRGPSDYYRPFLLDGHPPGMWHGEPFLVDGRPLGQSNWMRYVQAAQYEEEQNLVAFAGYDGNIYYRTRQTIPIGQELLVRKAGLFGWQPFAVEPLEEPDVLPEGVVLCATCKKVRLASDQFHECTDELREPPQSPPLLIYSQKDKEDTCGI